MYKIKNIMALAHYWKAFYDNSFLTKSLTNLRNMNVEKARLLCIHMIKNHYVFLIPALLFFILRLPYFMADVFTADELWHAGYMRNQYHDSNYKYSINYDGYSTAFWMLGRATYGLVGYTAFFFVLRLATLFSIILSAYAIHLILLEKQIHRHVALATLFAFFSIPFLWHTGKLIAPEMYMIGSFLMIAYFILKKEAKYLGLCFLALGFGTGMKLNGLPMAFAIFAFYFLVKTIPPVFSQKNIILALQYSVYFAVGVILCNYSVLIDANEFFENLSRKISLDTSFHPLYLLQEWFDFFFIQGMAWDLIRLYGANHLILPISNIILLSLVIFYNRSFDRKYCCAYIVSVIFLIAMITNSLGHIWYIFTIFLIIFLFYSHALNKAHGSKDMKNTVNMIALLIFFITNIYVVYPWYIEDYKNRIALSQDLNRSAEVTECLLERTKNYDYTNIYFSSFVGNHSGTYLITPSIFEKADKKIIYSFGYDITDAPSNEEHTLYLWHKMQNHKFAPPNPFALKDEVAQCYNFTAYLIKQ